MTFLNTILDIVFPAKCISCGNMGADLCIQCLSGAPVTEREIVKWIFPLYEYRHPPIKKALWFFKYKGRKRLAGIFAEVIYERIIEELSELSQMENFNNIVLMPIPLSAKRYKERGYNQAELICKEMIRLAKANRDEIFTLKNNILIKSKETEHQAHIKDKRIRLKNLTGSFSIKNEDKNISYIKNRNIILIDDIITTGATLNEAKKILKQAGARKIIAFTIAH